MIVLKYLILLLASVRIYCAAYRILVVFPFPSKSHSILGDGVVRHLLAAGHRVTYVTPFPKANPNPQLQQVDVSQAHKDDIHDMLNFQAIMDKKVDMGDENLIHAMASNITFNVLQDNNLRTLLNDPTQVFDAVITEWMFSEIYSGIAAVFECPLIWFFPFEDVSIVLRLIDEYPNPAYTPTLKLSSNLPYTFTERLISLWTHAKSEFRSEFYYLKDDSARYQEIFKPILSERGKTLPAFEDMRTNISLALVNAHISFGLSLKRPYNYINVGGYHIDTEVKPLPEDLKKIMNSAKHGVIYFSMGSNLQSKHLPENIKRGLLKLFSGLKQTVLWKFEEVLTDLPKNVHILKWAPQPSILSHPNCVLFITHGGLLSNTEIIHFGKPAIGIPVFGDQFNNVDNAVLKGYMKRVDLTYSLVDDLKVAINEIINEPRYAQQARELSAIYHDRPVPPGAELVHWVEHVVRTRSATHLRSPALQLAFYQKMYLDLVGLLIVLVLLVLLLFKFLLYLIKKPNPQNKKNKLN